jgi:type II secretory pathway predicted ATPase ExeA
MYRELFKLREVAFRLSPDPEFLYLSKNHARAKAYMESTIWLTDGFVVITGDIGAGKTTLIESFLLEVGNDVSVAQINQTQVTAVEFLQAVLAQFGFTPFRMKKAELLATFNNFLIEQHAAGRKVLLIVDEAQNLPLRTLEEIRMLSGVETTKEKVLRIILAGQPELNEKLDSPELVQLVQRVRLRFHLGALDEEDMRAYIRHRLEVAGANGREIFAEDCFPLIYRYSGGVPRLTNTLCETAMMAAFAADRDHVVVADVQAAIDELRWVEFRQRGREQARGRSGMDPTATDTGMAPVPKLYVAGPEGGHAVTGSEPLGKLLVITEGRTVGELPLKIGRTIIGRTPDNDLQIDNRFVSRHHCQIITLPDSCVVEDLNSTNGIVVRSRRVRRHTLRDGDVITIGKHDLIYVDERRGRKEADQRPPDPAEPAASQDDDQAAHGETHVL